MQRSCFLSLLLKIEVLLYLQPCIPCIPRIPRIPIIVIPQECKPDQAIIAALEANGTSWVDETLTLTICTNENTDNRRSFPSGHASQVRQLKYNDFKCFLHDLEYYSLIIYTICDDL